MWISTSSINKQTPSILSGNTNVFSIDVIGDSIQELNNTIFSDTLLYQFSFKPQLPKIAEDTEVYIKALNISSNTEEYKRQSIMKATDQPIAAIVSSAFNTTVLPDIFVFDTSHKDLYLMYELRLSNIAKYKDIQYLSKSDIVQIKLENKSLAFSTLVDLDTLAAYDFNFDTDVIITYRSKLYNINQTPVTIYNSKVIVKRLNLYSFINTLVPPFEYIDLINKGVYAYSSKFELKSFFYNKSHIHFVS